MRTPEGAAYSGHAETVRVPGSKGPFGVLPRHAPLMSSLDVGLTYVRDPVGNEWKFVTGRGFVEVVPFNTRRPNVPDAAWQNKVDGWVLVAFSVTPEGRTKDIRVLDAKPRGVFEEKVIAAVEDWTYRVSFYGQVSGQLVLTQKVEVQWKDYPQNMPNVD